MGKRSALQWVGGKFYMIKHLLPLIPKHHCYIEIFGGAGNLLFNKQPSKVEIFNDVNSELINFYKVIKNNYDEFYKEIEFMPYSRELFNECKDYTEGNSIQRAVKFFYINKISYCGIMLHPHYGYSKTKNQALKLHNAMELLKPTYERIKTVQIENLDFRQILNKYDLESSFFYFDPPYVLDARQSAAVYNHEMTNDDHTELLDMIINLKGKWLLSGYDNDIYKEKLKDYNKKTFDMCVWVGKTNKKATETVWFNYEIPTLFSNNLVNDGILNF